jgi:hypothetical protein
MVLKMDRDILIPALLTAGGLGLALLPRIFRPVRIGMTEKRIGRMTVRTVTVSIQNTGNRSWTYGVGCSVCGTASGTGCAITCAGSLEKDLPIQTLTLAPGATGSLSFTFDDADLAAGTHYAVVKAWKESVLPLTNCLDGRFASFAITEIVAASIISLTVS